MSPDKKSKKIFCTECGAALPGDSRFCGECGTKLAGAQTSAPVPTPELAKVNSGLDELGVEITSIEAEGPDSDSMYAVTVSYRVLNNTNKPVGSLLVHASLFNKDGVLIDSSQSNEDAIDVGDSADLQIYFTQIHEKLLVGGCEEVASVLEVTGRKHVSKFVGKFDLPEAPNQVAQIPECDIGGIKIQSGCFWRALPDRDKDINVYAKSLVQNTTKDHVAAFKFVARVLDKSGDELFDAGSSEDIKSAGVVTLGSYGYEKAKALEGAAVEITYEVATQFAQGCDSSKGATVSESDSSKDTDSDEDDGDFASLAATLKARSEARQQERESEEISTETIDCGGSFEIQIYGRGAETVIGKINKKQFKYWSEHPDDLEAHVAGVNDVNGDVGLGDWSDLDDIAHCSGPEFVASSTRISVTNSDGDEIWAADADIDALTDSGIDVETEDEIAIYQLTPGYYFCGRAYEKGSFFSATVEAEEFNPAMLKFVVRNINELVLLDSVYYDEEELDGNDGYSTSTYSSEFFVEESES